MTNEYLKPCPFCGGKAQIHRTYKGETEVASKIVCIDCLAIFYQAEANSAEENIEAWNKRPADQKPQPNTGRWINDSCSECGKGIEDLIVSSEWYRNENPKYCPFCGIKIQEV